MNSNLEKLSKPPEFKFKSYNGYHITNNGLCMKQITGHDKHLLFGEVLSLGQKYIFVKLIPF